MLLKLVAEGCFSAIAASFNPSFNRDALKRAPKFYVGLQEISNRFITLNRSFRFP